MADKTDKKQNVVDEAVEVVTDHPFITAAVFGVGCMYLYSKFQQRLIYKAVLKANIDGYNHVRNNFNF